MSWLLNLAYDIVRFTRKLRRRAKIIELRLRGVAIHSSATVDPGAIIEPSGGQVAIGARTFIDRGVIIRPLGGRVVIGDDCTVNAYSVLYGGGGLKVGNGVRIAAHVVIIPSNHAYSDPTIPIKDQGLTLLGINIENDVWIGAGARILDGVKVSEGTVIGAGAVVTKATEPYSIIGGVPAKKLKSRRKEPV